MGSLIYTRTGDSGDTSLACGQRLSKDDLRIEAYGTLDELSSVLGVVSALLAKESRKKVLPAAVKEDWMLHEQLIEWMQDKLFTLSAMIATANLPAGNLPQLSQEDVILLEQRIDEMEAVLPELKHFILPGGSELVSFVHLARTVCRRAERVCTALSRQTSLDPVILPFLNRLSDELFVFARWAGYQQGEAEKIWVGRKHPQQDNNASRVRLRQNLAARLEDGSSQLNLF